MTNSPNEFPGAHERHLLRKSNNPLFGTPVYTTSDLEQARLFDQEELNRFLAEVQQVIMSCLELGETAESEEVLKLKEQLEKLYERSCHLAGNLVNERTAIESVITPIVSAIEKNAANDPKTLQKLNDEKAARELHHELLKNKLLCDLLRPDSPITELELVPTLLSEPIDNILPVLDFLNQDQLKQLSVQGAALIEQYMLNTEHEARKNLQAINRYIQQATM